MQKRKIRKIIFFIVVPLLVIDTTLLFAATAGSSSSSDAILSRFQQQLTQAEEQQPAAPDSVPASVTMTATTPAPTPAQTAPKPAPPLAKTRASNLTGGGEFFSAKHMGAQGAAASKAMSQPSSSQTTQAFVMPAQQPAYPTQTLTQMTYPGRDTSPTVDDYMQEQPTADQSAAFDAVIQQSMPMTPGQITQMKRRMVASQRASAAPAETPAKPVTSSKIVNLAPGATPPVIRLSAGFISTLVFVDATGSNWPISAIDNGNPAAFNVSWDKKGNTIMIQAKKAYMYGNIAVSLKGSSTPVMLTLIPGQKEIDYRVDLRVSGLAPLSKDSVLGLQLPSTASNELLKVLDNVPPEGAKVLNLSGPGASAWLAHGKMYLRTRFVLLSPGYISVMKSPDGTHAYELQKTPSILVSQFGKPVELHVEGV